MTINRSFVSLDQHFEECGLEICEVGSYPVRSGETSPISGEWRIKLGRCSSRF
jgi:hypothetical protein